MPIALRAKKGTPKVSLKSRLTRDRSKPFTYRASGSLVLPASITKNATWCSGGVFISLTRGPVTVGATTVKLKPDCTYAKTVSVQGNARLARRNGRTEGTLKLGARFAGNTLLNAKSATSRTVRYGPR